MGKEVKSMNNVKVRTKLIIVMLAAFLAMTEKIGWHIPFS